jgi:hypothetical protein
MVLVIVRDISWIAPDVTTLLGVHEVMALENRPLSLAVLTDVTALDSSSSSAPQFARISFRAASSL